MVDDDESHDESLPEMEKSGPFCRIRRFLEQDSTLQIPPVSSFSPQTQPVSLYTYCNDAFRKLNQKNALSTPAVCAQSDTGEMPKRYCSEALIN
jgi:hypothetical protein